MAAPEFEWGSVSRYAFLVALAQLIPIPIVDAMVDSRIRRRLTRVQLAGWGLDLPPEDVRMLADGAAGGCLGLVKSVVLWPFKKVLRTVLFVLQINVMVNVFSEVVHRSLLLHEALELGLIPGDAVAVRAAMNRAIKDVDTRVVERAVLAVLTRSRRALLRLLVGERGRLRDEVAAARAGVGPGEGGPAPLREEAEAMTSALRLAVQAPGVQAELLRRFRAEARAL